MDTNSMTSLFTLIQLAVGLYCFYAWYQLRGNTIPEKFFLLNKDLTREKCLDQEYYCTYMRPRTLIFAIITTALGAIGMLDEVFGLLQTLCPASAYSMISLALHSFLPFTAVLWYVFCMMRIQKQLW